MVVFFTKSDYQIPRCCQPTPPHSSWFYLDQLLLFAHAPTTQESTLPPRYAIAVPWFEQACPSGTSISSAGDARGRGSLERRCCAGCGLPHDALDHGAGGSRQGRHGRAGGAGQLVLDLLVSALCLHPAPRLKPP